MDAIDRLLDANANRAREGLRVMEDHARFVLADPALAEQIKQTRHALSACFPLSTALHLMASRDAAGDVGRTISTPQERSRTGPHDIAFIAARRVTEALRCLEEHAKSSAGGAAALAAIRYAVYDLEQRLLLSSPRLQRLRDARLYVLLTESLCRAGWRETAAAALAGGADIIQLREKSLPDRELLDRAATLRHMTRDAGALLIVNDRPDIAALADADGVHVGQDDLPIPHARRVIGPSRIVGISTHSAEQVRAALADAPDYIAAGPMFPSTTKELREFPGPAFLAETIRRINAGASRQTPPIPVVAIGGISTDNLRHVLATGCRCVAVCAAVIAQDDPRSASANFATSLADNGGAIAQPAQ